MGAVFSARNDSFLTIKFHHNYHYHGVFSVIGDGGNQIKLKVVFKFPNGKLRAYGGFLDSKEAMKDAAWRRYAPGRCLATFDPEISEWGNPIR